jgi:hypothetical protein
MLKFTRSAVAFMVFGLLILCCCGGESSESEVQEVVPEAEQEPGVARMPFAEGSREAEVQEVIIDIISYMEGNDINGMLDKYIPPQDLAVIKESGRMVGVARRYGMFREGMLGALREALTLQPMFNADTSRVTFDVESAPTDLVFVRIGDRWYFPER